ncbi:MAG: S41 family peptidase [Vampirovibrionales bacterium]|nr:S41 family peptidase [Vampirovibrionales bacterium]
MAILALTFSSGCKPVPPLPDYKTQTDSLGYQALYQQVWEVVARDYVDPTANGQYWGRWQRKYAGLMQSQEDAYVAIETMLASLDDDYTRLLRPRDMAEQSIQIESRLFGVGLEISKIDQELRVIAPLPGSPAEAAGIASGDVITAINGEPAALLSAEQAADMIRGEKGTAITLTLTRKQNTGESKTWDLPLVRDEITLHTVFTSGLPQAPDVGYVRISSFIGESAPEDFMDAVEPFQDKKALIIDLRDNAGGLLSNAVALSDALLDSGRIVSIEGRNQKLLQTYSAAPGQVFRKPIAVLINGGSASASEIFAAALHDNHRATLLGTTSFGKGLVQKVVNLGESSNPVGLNITVSHYKTPNGQDIHIHGIKPDITIVNQPDPTLKQATMRLLRSKSEHVNIEAMLLRQDAVINRAVQVLTQNVAPTSQNAI